jgi:hypothetical protein
MCNLVTVFVAQQIQTFIHRLKGWGKMWKIMKLQVLNLKKKNFAIVALLSNQRQRLRRDTDR